MGVAQGVLRGDAGGPLVAGARAPRALDGQGTQESTEGGGFLFPPPSAPRLDGGTPPGGPGGRLVAGADAAGLGALSPDASGGGGLDGKQGIDAVISCGELSVLKFYADELLRCCGAGQREA